MQQYVIELHYLPGYFPRSETVYCFSDAYVLYYFCEINPHRFNQATLQYAE